MKRVTFKNDLWIRYDDTMLLPKITDTHWRASKLKGKFILNSNDASEGNLLMIGKHQDDKKWICSDYIAKINDNDLQ